MDIVHMLLFILPTSQKEYTSCFPSNTNFKFDQIYTKKTNIIDTKYVSLD
jgi:hypothetical protein